MSATDVAPEADHAKEERKARKRAAAAAEMADREKRERQQAPPPWKMPWVEPLCTVWLVNGEARTPAFVHTVGTKNVTLMVMHKSGVMQTLSGVKHVTDPVKTPWEREKIGFWEHTEMTKRLLWLVADAFPDLAEEQVSK
jgi:hypothetical protein